MYVWDIIQSFELVWSLGRGREGKRSDPCSNAILCECGEEIELVEYCSVVLCSGLQVVQAFVIDNPLESPNRAIQPQGRIDWSVKHCAEQSIPWQLMKTMAVCVGICRAHDKPRLEQSSHIENEPNCIPQPRSVAPARVGGIAFQGLLGLEETAGSQNVPAAWHEIFSQVQFSILL